MRLRGIELGEEPDTLTALGLSVRDGVAAVGGVAIHATGARGDRGLVALDVEGARPGPLPLRELPPADGEDDHPIGATAVDHVVVLCGDVRATLDAVGAEPRREDRRGDRHYAFVVADTALLEFVGPAEPDDRPPRLWGMAFTVRDLPAAAVHLGDALGRITDAVQPGRRIATVRHERLGLAVPTVLVSPRP